MNVRMIAGILAALLLAVSPARGQGPAVPPPAKSAPVSKAPRTPVKKAPAAPKVEDDEDRNDDRNDDEETPQSRAEEKREQENDLYDEGAEALDDGQYDRAAEKFGECGALGGEKADGALYWQAYAFNKLGRRAEALAKIAELQKSHPASRWTKETRALELEVRQADGQKVSLETGDDEDIKLMAINGLMNSDPERAMPLLEKILNGNQSPKIKDRALFVLAQNSSPQAREVMGRIARGQSNPDLQRKAIRNLGLFGGSESRKLLAEIYASSSDVEIKRAILGSFMLAGEREKLLTAAKGEKVPELRAEAVRQLGLLGAQAELWQLYQAESSKEVKGHIIQALFIGGGAERLGELARGEKDPELRRKAIRNLGLLGRQHTEAALVAIYASDTDPQDRREVIQAFFLQDNAHALVNVARTEKDPALRKDAIQKLSLMSNKEATDFLMEIINK
jgi:hypothetical protein